MANVVVTIPQQAQRYILKVEGGYYNGKDPRDPNETKYGITARTLSNAVKAGIVASPVVRDLTVLDAMKIYQVWYWNPCGADQVSLGLGIALVDGAINCGSKPTIRMLQRSLSALGDPTPDTGKLTPEVIQYANSQPEAMLLYNYLGFRLAYYDACIQRNAQLRAEGKTKVDLSKNKRGWINRLKRLAAEVGVAW